MERVALEEMTDRSGGAVCGGRWGWSRSEVGAETIRSSLAGMRVGHRGDGAVKGHPGCPRNRCLLATVRVRASPERFVHSSSLLEIGRRTGRKKGIGSSAVRDPIHHAGLTVGHEQGAVWHHLGVHGAALRSSPLAPPCGWNSSGSR